MTTILAVSGDGWASLGYDSLITEGGKKYYSSSAKYFQKDEMHFAFSGALKVGQFVNRELSIPPMNYIDSFEDLDRYVNDFIIRPLEKIRKKAEKIGKEYEETGLGMIIMWKGIILEVGFDLSYIRSEGGLLHMGSGEAYAAGAFSALYNKETQRAANEAIKKSIVIASEFDAYTSPPVHVISTKIKSNWKDN